MNFGPHDEHGASSWTLHLMVYAVPHDVCGYLMMYAVLHHESGTSECIWYLTLDLHLMVYAAQYLMMYTVTSQWSWDL